MSGLGKPIAFHPVRRHYTPSRAYWCMQAVGAWLIMVACLVIFAPVALMVSLFTANGYVIDGVAFASTLPFMLGLHYLLYRHTLAYERRRLGLEDTTQ